MNMESFLSQEPQFYTILNQQNLQVSSPEEGFY